MTTQEILGLLAVVLVVVGGVGGVIKMLLLRDRKSLDEQSKEAARINEVARAAIWRRLDELGKEMVDVRVEQGRLAEQLRHIPDHDDLHEKFKEMETQLENKLEHLFRQFQETFAIAAAKFRCPHDPST